MKDKLKKITDKTIQDLLQNEIILPSSYFKYFDNNAKKISVALDDPQFENDFSDVLTEELNTINSYMKKALNNINILTKVTDYAQKAITEKDESKLKTVNSALVDMKSEINALRTQIYIDPLTKIFNRKWIYNQGITESGTFKSEGLLLFIDLTDCNYLTDKYGSLLADNVILFVAKFLKVKFKNEKISADIARYSNNHFVLFIKNETIADITSLIKNMQIELASTTLKSKSGLMFKTNFHFGMVQYSEIDSFQNKIEKAAALSIEEKERTDKLAV